MVLGPNVSPESAQITELLILILHFPDLDHCDFMQDAAGWLQGKLSKNANGKCRSFLQSGERTLGLCNQSKSMLIPASMLICLNENEHQFGKQDVFSPHHNVPLGSGVPQRALLVYILLDQMPVYFAIDLYPRPTKNQPQCPNDFRCASFSCQLATVFVYKASTQLLVRQVFAMSSLLCQDSRLSLSMVEWADRELQACISSRINSIYCKCSRSEVRESTCFLGYHSNQNRVNPTIFFWSSWCTLHNITTSQLALEICGSFGSLRIMKRTRIAMRSIGLQDK
ncbi:hypothetical protein B0H19DRAFT_1227681, partial [Mycena capillaripes]